MIFSIEEIGIKFIVKQRLVSPVKELAICFTGSQRSAMWIVVRSRGKVLIALGLQCFRGIVRRYDAGKLYRGIGPGSST